ncbi:putative small heat-shock protein [Hibiscus syriacus]|uniref:Small heat-shock protein n=1 Tax=Hibiscus syriacus TaxID=106335 RepID=A0A6A3BQU7_HIBSY|nr:putative small heat-shock protein [Hibiscus syriacus]
MNLLGASVLYLDSSGCLGCYERPTFNPLVNESSKRLKVQGQTGKKASISENFWTTSTCDMDNSAMQSRGSISSISIRNQTLDPHGSVAAANAPAEFVNHGKFLVLLLLSLLMWNQIRQRWVGNRKSENRKRDVLEPKLNLNATYESLLGSNKPFPQPIPLSEMIDFLVDVWEQEGLYD